MHKTQKKAEFDIENRKFLSLALINLYFLQVSVTVWLVWEIVKEHMDQN